MEKYILIKGKGPILITAPHVVNTIRKDKIHPIEYNIYLIVNKLYDILGKNKCTLVTWNQEKIKKCNIKNLPDPNHKKENQHTWINIIRALHAKKKFTFHLDFHGMNNKTTPNVIDIGLGYNFSKRYSKMKGAKIKSTLVNEFKRLEENTEISKKFRGGGCLFYKTLTSLTRKIEIFSIQLEIDKWKRKEIVESTKKINLLAKIILNLNRKINKIIKKKNYVGGGRGYQGKFTGAKNRYMTQGTRQKNYSFQRTRKKQPTQRPMPNDIFRKHLEKDVILAEKQLRQLMQQCRLQRVTPTLGTAWNLMWKVKDLMRRGRWKEAAQKFSIIVIILSSYNPNADPCGFNEGEITPGLNDPRTPLDSAGHGDYGIMYHNPRFFPPSEPIHFNREERRKIKKTQRKLNKKKLRRKTAKIKRRIKAQQFKEEVAALPRFRNL